MRPIVAPLALAVLSIPLILAVAPAQSPAASGKVAGKKPVLDPSRKTPLQAMLAAEVSFARRAATTNIRDAFLANLAPDAVVFRPLPVNAVQFFEGRPVTTAQLLWEPGWAEIAAAGDLGVTSGPSEFHPADSSGTSYGTFLSVWRHDAAKGWKVVLDCGISHPAPAAGVGSTTFTSGPLHDPAETPPESLATGTLRIFDQSLTQTASAMNPARAIAYWTAPDLRYLREGELPYVGDDARNAMSRLPRHTAWRVTDVGIAGSGDLGYTYGVREDSSDVAGKGPDSTVYVHVWRKVAKNQWRIGAAVDRPLHSR